MKKLGVGLCLVVLASLCAAPASASLIGDEVMVSLELVGFSTDGPFAVTVESGDGDAVLFGPTTIGPNRLSVDIESESIIISNIDTNPLSLTSQRILSFTDLDWIGVIGSIVGITVDSDVAAIDNSDVSWNNGPDGSDVFLNITAIWDVGATVVLNLETTHEVPEPTTMALLGMGAAGLIAKRQRVV